MTINSLIDKRRRLHGDLIDTQNHYRKLKADIAALDHTLILMGYNGYPSDLTPIRKHTRLFEPKELTRLIIDIQRERPDLPTNQLIAIEVIKRKDWDTQNEVLLETVKKGVTRIRDKHFKSRI